MHAADSLRQGDASDTVMVHRWERNLSGNKAAIVTAAPEPAPSVSPFGPPGADGSVVINPVSNGGGGLPIEALPFQPAGWGGEVDRDAGSVSQATRPLP